MTETPARIRWEAGAEAGLSAWLGLVGQPPLFAYAINRPPAGEAQHTLVSQLPRPEGQYLDGDPEDLKAEAEGWLQEYVSRLGAAFPEPGTAQVVIEEEGRPALFFDEHDLAVIAAFDDDEGGEPLEVKYAAGRRVRYAHPGAGYPGEAEHAAASLVIGEVYTIGWADIGQSRTNLNLYRGGEAVGSFNSVFFDLTDEETPANPAPAGEKE